MIAAVKLLHAHCRIYDLSQRELSLTLGATEGQVSKWMNGRHNPCKAWQIRIANVLGGVNKPNIHKMRRIAHAESEKQPVVG